MKHRSRFWFAILTLVMLSYSLVLAACGDATSTTAPSSTTIAASTTGDTYSGVAGNTVTTAVATSGTSGGTGTVDNPAVPAPTSRPATTAAAAATTAAAIAREGAAGAPGASDEAAKAPPVAAAATTAARSSGTTAAASGAVICGTAGACYSVTSPPVPQQPNQDPLQAGSVDDNLKFSEYLNYLNKYTANNVLRFDVSERYIISVMDSNARTVANANVTVKVNGSSVFEGKTYSNGQIMFFPRALKNTQQASEFEVNVTAGNQTSTSRKFKRGDQQSQGQDVATIWTMQMPGSLRPTIEQSPLLDVLFLIDTTGSMGGEIRKIQSTIGDISVQIDSLPGTPKVRYGAVAYRDRGDSYVTRKFDFTANLDSFSGFLNQLSAGGGGDYPESLNEALNVAINNMNWRTEDAVRLTFLVSDAPPHLDYSNDVKYTDSTIAAMRKGIKIYAIGTSGLTPQGEYIFRQMSQMTLAQYLFVTRGGDENSSGSGGAASKTDVIYTEKQLDRMVVNIVRREITNLTQ